MPFLWFLWTAVRIFLISVFFSVNSKILATQKAGCKIVTKLSVTAMHICDTDELWGHRKEKIAEFN